MISIDENNILVHKEYNISQDKDYYKLKIDIDKEYIYFKLKKSNNLLDYFYTNKTGIITLISMMNLEDNYKSNIDLLIKVFDKFYEEKKMMINNINNDINIIFQDSNIKCKINLIKENLSIDEKLNMIYYEIKSKNINNNYKIENNIQFEYLNNINPNCDSNKNKNEKYDIMLNRINDFILQKDKDKINIIETIDKKIGETIKLP